MNLHGKGWSEDLSSKEIVVDDIQKIENKFQNSLNKEIKTLAGSSKYCIVAGLISAVLLIKFRNRRKQQ